MNFFIRYFRGGILNFARSQKHQVIRGVCWNMMGSNVVRECWVFGFGFVHFKFFLSRAYYVFIEVSQLQIFINLCPLWDREGSVCVWLCVVSVTYVTSVKIEFLASNTA